MSSKDKTKTLVNKLTTDNRNPPSGYLLQELAKRTVSVAESQIIEDLIIKRLNKSKPYIKYKTLRVIKFLCDNGSQNWRRAWQRQTDRLRDCQNFRGTPDPIYGDTPYLQVRTAAKDCLQAVFQTNTMSQVRKNLSIKIEGKDGNSSMNSTFANGSTGTYSNVPKSRPPPTHWSPPNNKYSYPNKTNNSSDVARPMPGFGSDPNYKSTAPKTNFAPLKSSGPYNPVSFTENRWSKGPADSRGRGRKREKGAPGGAWGANPHSEDEEEDDFSDDDSNTREHNNNNHHQRSSFGGRVQSTSSTSHDGRFEQRWIDSIVKSGGIGSNIRDINKYIQQFENLSKAHALEYLDNKMEVVSTWQLQAKALALIEGLLSGQSTDDVMEYFKQSPDNIVSMKNASKSILRKKAQRLCDLLGLVDTDQEPAERDFSNTSNNSNNNVQQPASISDTISSKQSSSTTTTMENFLDLGSGSTDVVDNNADSGNLFENMITDDSNTASNDVNDMFTGMNLNANNNNNNNINNNNTAPQQPQQPLIIPSNEPKNLLLPEDIPSPHTLKHGSTDNAITASKNDFAFLDELANDSLVKQTDATTDLTDLLYSNNNQPTANMNMSGSAFDIDLGVQNTSTTAATNNNTSAFGLNMNAATTVPQPTPPLLQAQAQAQAQTSGFNFMNANTAATANANNVVNTSVSPIPQQQITPQLMSQNQQNIQYMASLMQQMQQMQQIQQMQSMSIGMNPMNRNLGNVGSTANPMMSFQQQNMNQFQQNMASLSKAKSNSSIQGLPNPNDPFASMINQNAAQPNRPTQPQNDPFAEFSINNAMKR
jgi:hypothetical protein